MKGLLIIYLLLSGFLSFIVFSDYFNKDLINISSICLISLLIFFLKFIYQEIILVYLFGKRKEEWNGIWRFKCLWILY